MSERPRTVMIRNIPCRFSREEAMSFLDEVGLRGLYDLVYLPMNSSGRANLGYIFVDFVSTEAVQECRGILTGRKFGISDTTKRCEVSYARMQGCEVLKKEASKMKHASKMT